MNEQRQDCARHPQYCTSQFKKHAYRSGSADGMSWAIYYRGVRSKQNKRGRQAQRKIEHPLLQAARNLLKTGLPMAQAMELLGLSAERC